MNYKSFMVCVIVHITLCKANQDVVRMPQSILEKHIEGAKKCMAETGAPSDILSKLVTWSVTDDDVTKKFIYCFAMAAKVADEDGHVYPNRFDEILKNHERVEEYRKHIIECNKRPPGKDNIDTLFKAGTCINREGPIVFTL